ncbi:Cation channel sperm-associated protein 2, partial [Coelomomyces lativittatus]
MASSSTLLKTTTSPSQRPLNPTSATTTKTTTATANATSASSAQPNLDDDQDALDDKDFAPDFELAFHDLSIRSSLFRTKLIEEFQLLENLGVSTTMAYPPQYNTCDVRDKPTFQKMLKENPCQLIKFQTLKRTQLHADIDRRLTRIRNKDKVPLGAWAAWVLESKAWELFLITVIIVNAIMVGIIAELSDSEADHVDLFRVLLYLDHFSLYVFYLEIGLKWLDKFNDYWKDAWNFFDFGITVATTIPELIGLFSTEDSSSSGNSFNLIVRQLRTFRILRTLKL